MARAIDEIAYEGKAGTILVENPLLAEYVKLGHIDRLRELAQADREGRVVVLPFQQHKTLFNMSDPQHPELLKDFRISATWTHCGIVFHSPWGIFLQQIEQGYIKQVSEEAEAALEAQKDG